MRVRLAESLVPCRPIISARGRRRGRPTTPVRQLRSSPRTLVSALRRSFRQLARSIKHLSYRALTVREALGRRADPLVPPAHLRVYYYGTTNRAVFTERCEGARAELLSRGLQPADRVL